MDNQNNIWIDRQEYERLKTLETQPQNAPVIASGPVVDTSASHSKMSPLAILTGVFAVVSFVFPPAILIFLGLGIASLVKFFRSRSSGKTKTAVGVAVGLGVTAAVVVFGPFLLLIGFMILWQLGCWTGLGSCTTA